MTPSSQADREEEEEQVTPSEEEEQEEAEEDLLEEEACPEEESGQVQDTKLRGFQLPGQQAEEEALRDRKILH